MTRRERYGLPLGVAAAVLAAVVGVVLATSVGTSRPAPLPIRLASGSAADAARETVQPGAPAHGGAAYRIAASLDGLPTSGSAYRVLGGRADADDVRRIAALFGLTGEPQRADGGWRLRDGEREVFVSDHPGRPWHYTPFLKGGGEVGGEVGICQVGVESACNGSGAAAGAGAGSAGSAGSTPATTRPRACTLPAPPPGASPQPEPAPDCGGMTEPAPCPSDADCAPPSCPADTKCPTPPCPADTKCPAAPCPPDTKCLEVCTAPPVDGRDVAVGCVEQPPAPPLPSEAQARAAFAPLLDRLGLADAAVTLRRGWDTWDAVVRPRIGGLPTLGMETNLALGADLKPRYANGWLAPTEKADEYPLLDPKAALDRHRATDLPLGRPEPAVLCDATTPECSPIAEAPPRTVTAVELGLLLLPAAPDASYLVPAWLLTVEGSDGWPEAVVAVPDAYLAPPTVDGPRDDGTDGRDGPDGGTGGGEVPPDTPVSNDGTDAVPPTAATDGSTSGGGSAPNPGAPEPAKS